MKSTVNVSNLRKMSSRTVEVLIQATRPEWWEFNQNERLSTQHAHAPEAKYIAFYQTAPISAITHIADVVSSRLEKRKVTFALYPTLLNWGDPRVKHKVYQLKNLRKLQVQVCKGEGQRNPGIRNTKKTTLDKLLRARTLSELRS